MGLFDENDVDGMLMRLRAFTSNRMILELANFVAHNDMRDKGVATDALEAIYLNLKFLTTYGRDKPQLKIDEPFPAYVVKLFNYQVERASSALLKSEHNTSKKQVLAQIKSAFSIDTKNKLAVPTGKITTSQARLFSYLVSFLEVRPPFNQREIFLGFLEALTQNKLSFQQDILEDQADKIIACVLLLLHQTKFRFDSDQVGACYLVSKVRFVKAQDIPVGIDPDELLSRFEGLGIQAEIPLPNAGTNNKAVFSLMDTELQAKDWCANNLLVSGKLDLHSTEDCVGLHFGDGLHMDGDSKFSTSS